MTSDWRSAQPALMSRYSQNLVQTLYYATIFIIRLALSIIALLLVYIIIIIANFYWIVSAREYARLSACAGEKAVILSNADAIKLARDSARDWGNVKQYHIEIDPNPNDPTGNPPNAHVYSQYDSWGFKYYVVIFSDPRGAELNFTNIDQCGHYFPDSVLTMSPDPGP